MSDTTFLDIIRRMPKNGPTTASIFFDIDLTYPGVNVPMRVRREWGDCAVFLIEKEYFDLTIGEDRISVILIFNGVAHKCFFPFQSFIGIRVVDPNYMLFCPPVEEKGNVIDFNSRRKGIKS